MVVASYDECKMDEEFIAAVGFDLMICDESHYIKNPNAKRTQALQRLVTPYVVLMTGTPLENSPDELWTTLNICDPGRVRRLPGLP